MAISILLAQLIQKTPLKQKFGILEFPKNPVVPPAMPFFGRNEEKPVLLSQKPSKATLTAAGPGPVPGANPQSKKK
jgi:hypothetical protein